MSSLVSTDRLVLVRFDDEDTDAIFDLHNDPDVMQFLNGGESTPRDIIVSQTMPLLMGFADDVFGFWKVLHTNGDFLGWCSLRHSDSNANSTADSCASSNAPQAEVGYRFCRQSWGQGYCSEAMRLLVKTCFEETAIESIVATTYEDNLASIRIMEKLGMTFTRSFKWDESLSPGTTYQSETDQWPGVDVEYSLAKETWLASNT